MNDDTSQEPTLVLNGTGKIGRRVVARLTARGRPVRIGSRSGEPRFDWEDRSTWGPVLEGVGSAYVSHHFDAIPGAAEMLGLVRRTVRAERRFAPRPLVWARRAGGRACGAGSARLRRRADGPAIDLVRPELQRGLLAGNGPGRRGRASGRRYARAVRRRRRHRRRRGRGADRRSARRRGLRAHRAPAAHVRGGGRRDLAGAGPRDPLRADLDRGLRRRRSPSRAFRARSSRCWPTSSARSSTAATLTWPTACNARSAASRATSPTTRATRPLPASGTRAPARPLEDIQVQTPTTAHGAQGDPYMDSSTATREHVDYARHVLEHPATVDALTDAHGNADIALGAAVIAMGLLAVLSCDWAVTVMPALTAATTECASTRCNRRSTTPAFPVGFLAPGGARRGRPRSCASPRLPPDRTLDRRGPRLLRCGDPPHRRDPHRAQRRPQDRRGPRPHREARAVRDDFATPRIAWHIVRALATTATFGALAWALILRGRTGRTA